MTTKDNDNKQHSTITTNNSIDRIEMLWGAWNAGWAGIFYEEESEKNQ